MENKNTQAEELIKKVNDTFDELETITNEYTKQLETKKFNIKGN